MSPAAFFAGPPPVGELLPKALCAAFTGRRPQSLPWGFDESDARCIALKTELEAQIRRAYSEGIRCFLSGMAAGVDTYAAEAVLRLKNELTGVKLVAVFPYGTGVDARQRRIALRADTVISLSQNYVTGCMQVRNRFLAEHCSQMICVCSGGSFGGTAETMRMASGLGVRLVVLRV